MDQKESNAKKDDTAAANLARAAQAVQRSLADKNLGRRATKEQGETAAQTPAEKRRKEIAVEDVTESRIRARVEADMAKPQFEKEWPDWIYRTDRALELGIRKRRAKVAGSFARAVDSAGALTPPDWHPTHEAALADCKRRQSEAVEACTGEPGCGDKEDAKRLAALKFE